MATEAETPNTEATGTTDEAAAETTPRAEANAEATESNTPTVPDAAAAAATPEPIVAAVPTYPPPVPHGPILEIKTDLYYVRSSLKCKPLFSISRNMIILRNNGELTLLNPVRLSAQGEEELKKLGEIKHVVRLGMLNGRDDAYYKDTYKAQFWAPGTSETYPEPIPDKIIKEDEGEELPFPDAQVIVFDGTKGGSECVILLKRDGGCLFTCDALQYYGDWKWHSPVARMAMPAMGYRGCCIAKPWLTQVTPEGKSLKPDFDRVAQLEFDTLISAHGCVLESGAKEAVTEAIQKMFPQEPK